MRARQLWGNIVYTQDSDLVAVLMHNGFYNHSLQQPPASMAEVPIPCLDFKAPYWGRGDLVAVLMHTGFCDRLLQQPPASMAECALGAQAGPLAPNVTPLQGFWITWGICCCWCFPLIAACHRVFRHTHCTVNRSPCTSMSSQEWSRQGAVLVV